MATARRRDPLVQRCLAEEIPLVLINRTVASGEVSSVVNDDEFGMELAVAHMARCGHARIAHLAGPLDLSTGFTRHRGFIKAMKEVGLKADPRLIGLCSSFNETEGRRVFLGLRAGNRRFTAVVAANDLLAVGCYDALHELGLRAGREVAVTGFNDMPFVDKLRPPLTTVRIPHYQMGAQAARMLLARLRDPHAPIEHVTLRPELVVRDSTGRAPRTSSRSRGSAGPAGGRRPSRRRRRRGDRTTAPARPPGGQRRHRPRRRASSPPHPWR